METYEVEKLTTTEIIDPAIFPLHINFNLTRGYKTSPIKVSRSTKKENVRPKYKVFQITPCQNTKKIIVNKTTEQELNTIIYMYQK